MAYKKNEIIFHSELVGMSQPVRLTVVGKVKHLKSKNKDLVDIKLEDGERCYWIENNNCIRAFSDNTNKTIEVNFSGAREEATAIVSGGQQQSSPARQENNAVQQQTKTNAPAQQTQEPNKKANDAIDNLIEFKKFMARHGNAITISACETLRAIENFYKLQKLEFTNETRIGYVGTICDNLCNTTFTTMFIAAKDAGMTDILSSSQNLAELFEKAKQRLAEKQSH